MNKKSAVKIRERERNNDTYSDFSRGESEDEQRGNTEIMGDNKWGNSVNLAVKDSVKHVM